MAEITVLVSFETKLVDTLNDAVIAPAGIVTLVGTSALRLLDASETTVPPTGAGPEMLMVHVVEVPPETGAFVYASERGNGHRIVRSTLWFVS